MWHLAALRDCKLPKAVMAHVENPGRCLSQKKCTEGSLSHCRSSLRHVRLSLIPRTTAPQASLSSISQSLLKFMFIESIQSDRIISSSVDPFSSCPQSFPASGSFPVSGLFPLGGQNIGASALLQE